MNPLNDGLRLFKEPPVLPGERANHQWSFVTPTDRMIADSQSRGMPLSQEQLRAIILDKLTGGK